MKLAPIQKKRIYQYIIEQIKASIENGELLPGDKLPSERELADKLSVSRSAVREAFSVLDSAGLVRIMQGIGVFLKEDENEELITRMNDILNPHGVNLVELLEVRQGIEGQAAYLAAIRRSEADLQKIKTAYNHLEQAVAAQQVAAEEDYAFHISVVKASQNSMLLQAVKFLSDKFLQGVHQSRSESLKIPGKSQMVLAEHVEILNAIAEQDPEKAQQAMWQHLQNVKLRYLK
ncbi:GntR family transcriptional regulator [Collibacillus ludicampi]|uniref:GntR family transcriptional regulator n=1 Tax=Collibacillus ludicampi TaxID=2771369 RepID=A0AAV4LE11_9BACL|nr:FadR/GntR family transcriptional regulator [Collibacillus ludicampi]GIM46005.1 GntR family transcriptional regulator [Collibacillus ludicampi]